MPKNKAKVIASKTMGDADLHSMFNQMVGTEAPDPTVIAPKYEEILKEAKSIMEVLKRTFLISSHISDVLRDDFSRGFEDIEKFCENGSAELESLTLEKKAGVTSPEDIAEMSENQKKVQDVLASLQCEYDIDKLAKNYKKLKEGSEIIDAIVIARRDILKIVEESKHHHRKKQHDLHDRDTLSDSFIDNFDEDYLQVFPSISVLDFKQLWLHEHCNYEVRRRIVYALYLILKKSDKIVHHIMTPDIDVSAFAEILVGHMDGLRKVIPRCDKAFNKIKQSVDMLKDNFGGYYKDYVESGSQSILVENFILDVAEGSSADPEVTRQFRQIVDFYRKKMSEHGATKDPKVQKMFSMINENLSVLETKTGASYGRKEKKEQPDDETTK